MFKVPPEEEGYRFADNFESWTEACERRRALLARKRYEFFFWLICSVLGALAVILIFSGCADASPYALNRVAYRSAGSSDDCVMRFYNDPPGIWQDCIPINGKVRVWREIDVQGDNPHREFEEI